MFNGTIQKIKVAYLLRHDVHITRNFGNLLSIFHVACKKVMLAKSMRVHSRHLQLAYNRINRKREVQKCKLI